MNNRIKELRKELKYSQDEFGLKINLSRSHVASIENGLKNITDRVINDICREFNVNEEWLRTGAGEMFKKVPEEDEVALYISELLEDNGNNPIFTIIKEIMHTYSQLDNKSQEVLKDYGNKLLTNLRETKIEG